MGPTERGRSGTALLLAAGLHAGIFLCARFVRTDSSVLDRGLDGFGHRSTLEIEIDFEPPSSGEPTNRGEIASVAPALRTRVTRSRPVQAEEPSSAPGAAEADDKPENEKAPESGSSERRSLAELGIGSSTALLDRPSPAPSGTSTDSASSERIDRMLVEELAKRDREKGIGSDGPVLSVLERATYASGVPANSTALFVARIDGSGRLSLLDVVESNGDHAGWTDVAKSALGRLGKKKIRLPAGARGMEFRIRVSSREALPSGVDPGLEIRAFKMKVKKGGGKKSAKMKILEPVAEIREVEVPLPGGKSIKYPVPVIELRVFETDADPSDIGAKPRRMVHATVESQKML